MQGRDGMGWDGMGWDGMGWERREWDAMGRGTYTGRQTGGKADKIKKEYENIGGMNGEEICSGVEPGTI